VKRKIVKWAVIAKNEKCKAKFVSRESYLVKKKEVRSQYPEVRRLLADGV